MDNFCVYSYTDPREKLPFYIGKGLPQRPYHHLLDCCRLSEQTRFYNKLNKLLSQGVIPDIKIIVSGLSNDDACDVEKHLIKEYGRLDIGTGCLTNHTNGGEGISGRRSIVARSLEQRQKVSNFKSQLTRSNMRLSHAYRQRCIESYDLDTGIICKQYLAIKDVVADGFTRTAIQKVLSGERQSSGHLGWRYLER